MQDCTNLKYDNELNERMGKRYFQHLCSNLYLILDPCPLNMAISHYSKRENNQKFH